MRNHAEDGLHVRRALHVVMLAKLAVAIPATARDLLAVASNGAPRVTGLGRVVATEQPRHIGVEHHDVVGLRERHGLG